MEGGKSGDGKLPQCSLPPRVCGPAALGGATHVLWRGGDRLLPLTHVLGRLILYYIILCAWLGDPRLEARAGEHEEGGDVEQVARHVGEVQEVRRLGGAEGLGARHDGQLEDDHEQGVGQRVQRPPGVAGCAKVGLGLGFRVSRGSGARPAGRRP